MKKLAAPQSNNYEQFKEDTTEYESYQVKVNSDSLVTKIVKNLKKYGGIKHKNTRKSKPGGA